MTITWQSVAAGGNGATSSSITYPTSSAGDLFVVHGSGGSSANNAIAYAGTGFTALSPQSWNTNGTFGVDAGPRRTAAWWKEALGTESGFQNVSLSGGSCVTGSLHHFTSDVGDWDIVHVVGDDSTEPPDTSLSITFPSIDLAPGDLILLAITENVDTATLSSPSISATGIGFGTITSRVSRAQTTGNDQRHIAYTIPVDSGSGSVAVTFSWTASTACNAAAVLVRIRDTTAGGPVSGTASLVYGGSVAVTGQPTRLGTGSAAYGGSVTATGQAQRLGTAALAYGGTVTATGTIPPETGTAALAYGGSVAAVGQAQRLGTGVLAYGGAVAATGEAQRLGTVALDYGGTVTATGTIRGAVTGTATLAYGGSVAATAAPAELGTGTLAYGGAVAATGTPVRLGIGALAYGGTVTGTGQTPGGPILGTGSLVYGGSLAGTGLVRRSGTGALGYGGAVAATGYPVEVGTSALGYGGVVAGAGTAVRLGAGALAYGGVLEVSGLPAGLGAAGLVYGGVLVAAGTAVRLGTSVLAYGGSVAAVPMDLDPSRPAVIGRAAFGRLARPRFGVITVRPGRQGRIGF